MHQVKDKKYEPVIGLEVHAELQTRSKMFCGCAVIDPTQATPNMAVCPVCSGMPGVLPVVNQQAVEYGLRVALALECTIPPRSMFARKNYFYPDLPKGYQISQYEFPLAENGRLLIPGSGQEQEIRIRRVHLEEDTGKLTHINDGEESYSLVDLNRAGVPLLEIVSEPDMHSVEAAREYATSLRALLRYLGVNSGDMEKGAIRFEANVSIRPVGTTALGTRVEIKNLNSFKAMEKAVAFEIDRQAELAQQGIAVHQETLGWDDSTSTTFSQRGKEEAHDYRYFPEPDLPPLVIEKEWIEKVAAAQPELPQAKARRFREQYELSLYDTRLLVEDQSIANYFEAVLAAVPELAPKATANWINGDLFSLMNQHGDQISQVKVSPQNFARLLQLVAEGKLNHTGAKLVLAEIYASGRPAASVVSERGLEQISDESQIIQLVSQVLEQYPGEVSTYLAGKETIAQWFFGQVMRQANRQANPRLVQTELARQLAVLKENYPSYKG